MLIPVLVSGYGRSGTTALMALLATDPRIAFDRQYPFENRYLTYLAKFCLLASRPGPSPHFDAVKLNDYNDDHFGPVPWRVPESTERKPLMPSEADCLHAQWSAFSASTRLADQRFTHYGEKVPDWLPATVRDVLPCRTINLIRDPRDVFLSARDFVQARNAVGFGMLPGTPEIENARTLAHRLLGFAENARDSAARGDPILVRYEDLVRQPRETADRINSFLGLTVMADHMSMSHLDSHRTSASVEASVGRWRREPLSEPVQACLETQLRRHLMDNGYELTRCAAEPLEVVPHPQMPCSTDGSLRVTSEGAHVTVTGGDFHVELPARPWQTRPDDEIWACVRGETGDQCSMYWRARGEVFAEERCVHMPFRTGRHWQVLRFKVGKNPLWRGTVEQVRADLFNGTVRPGKGGDVKWVRYVQ
jgi:hypothetical protein